MNKNEKAVLTENELDEVVGGWIVIRPKKEVKVNFI